MQVMLMRLMSKGEYVIVPKGTKFRGAGKLGLKVGIFLLFFPKNTKLQLSSYNIQIHTVKSLEMSRILCN